MRDLTGVVVTGGTCPPLSVLDELPESLWVIAADSGLDHARHLGLTVDVLVGDLDSVSPEAVRGFGGPVQQFPADKDHTDLELALGLMASQEHIERVIVIGGGGGRVDHLLGNVSVLAAPQYSHLRIEWLTGDARIHIVWDHTELHGSPGDVVSILPIGGPAERIVTEGLRWPLQGETLEPGSSRSVSNELSAAIATVRVGSGCVVTVQPEAQAS